MSTLSSEQARLYVATEDRLNRRDQHNQLIGFIWGFGAGASTVIILKYGWPWLAAVL